MVDDGKAGCDFLLLGAEFSCVCFQDGRGIDALADQLDLRHGQPQLAECLDARRLVQLVRAVQAIARPFVHTRRLQQAFLLVEAQGFDRQHGKLREFSDLQHGSQLLSLAKPMVGPALRGGSMGVSCIFRTSGGIG